jgi:selenocysteine-specific elongation factor
MMAILKQRLFNPPSPEELRQELGLEEAYFQELLAYLLHEQQVVKVSQDVYFSTQAIEEGKARLDKYFCEDKELSLATARDLFDTSRKYALPLVEYYDRIRFTRRVGDMRVKL